MTRVKSPNSVFITLAVSQLRREAMYKRILVPVDGSPTSTRGLDEAVRLAKLTGADIRLVHVLDRFVLATGLATYTADVFGVLREAGEEILQQMKARVAASGIDVTTWISDPLAGRVCDMVMDQAKDFDADLIVLGTHGRRGVGRMLLGSDAEQILRTATVPVLLVHSPETKIAAAAVDAA
jgi:nucleotide-binding universal stress UspA family protein